MRFDRLDGSAAGLVHDMFVYETKRVEELGSTNFSSGSKCFFDSCRKNPVVGVNSLQPDGTRASGGGRSCSLWL